MSGGALPVSAAVREPLSAIVQVDREAARRRACAQDVQSPATPHQRLVADARTSDDAVRSDCTKIYAGLDPVLLLRDTRAMQERLAALADTFAGRAP